MRGVFVATAMGLIPFELLFPNDIFEAAIAGPSPAEGAAKRSAANK